MAADDSAGRRKRKARQAEGPLVKKSKKTTHRSIPITDQSGTAVPLHETSLSPLTTSADATEQPIPGSPMRTVTPEEPVAGALPSAAHQPQAEHRASKRTHRKAKASKKLKAEKTIGVDTQSPMVPDVSPYDDDLEPPTTNRSWLVSSLSSSSFVHVDPVFSSDEKTLALASRRAIHLYSTSSSVEDQRLTLEDEGNIIGIDQTGLSKTAFFSATDNGVVAIWDRRTGTVVDTWSLGSKVTAIATSVLANSDRLFVYVVAKVVNDKDDESTAKAKIVSHEVDVASNQFVGQPVILLNSPHALRSIHTLDNGVVVSYSRYKLVVGRPAGADTSTYDWFQLPVLQEITCLDLRDSTRSKSSSPDVDVVFGVATGELFVFAKILSKLKMLKELSKDAAINPRRLHWHRSAVGAVKWSRDGNYIVSGGQETVLVIWQLSTGKLSTLPHLTAGIEALVISRSGASYALRLSDNSVMILSATELKPTAYVSGIQARVIPDRFFRKLSALESFVSKLHVGVPLRTPMVVDPNEPTLIHLAVPQSQLPRPGLRFPPTSYLQTFDLSTGRHVRKQALTRNYATIANVGPLHTPLFEPDVTLMALSFDGSWMATVEEWSPPQSDVAFLSTRQANEDEQSSWRTEVYLKFWKWDSNRSSWSLNSRIEHAHAAVGNSIHRIRSIASHPARLAFSTVGDDCIVRTWTAKVKTRRGVPIRTAGNSGLVSWSVSTATELDKGAPFVDLSRAGQRGRVLTPVASQVAYSSDGSVFAASIELPAGDTVQSVHLLDSTTGEIIHSEPDLYTSGLAGLSFAGSHIVILAATLTVWDLVSYQRVYSVETRPTGRLPLQVCSAFSHLATNMTGEEFAIALPTIDQTTKKVKSDIIVLSSRHPDRKAHVAIDGFVTALVPVPRSDDFLVIDSNAEVRLVRSPQSHGLAVRQIGGLAVKSLSGASPARLRSIKTGRASARSVPDDDVEMDVHLDDGLLQAVQLNVDPDSGRVHLPTVRPSQLAEVFGDGSIEGMAPLPRLFRSLASLVMAKPRTVHTS